MQLGLRALRVRDVVDDRVEQAPAVDFDRPRVHLDVADLARGQAMAEAEGVLALAGGLAHGGVDLRHGQAVDVGDLALDQLVAGVAVEGAGRGVGLHDPTRVGVDEELHRQILLEDLAMDVLAAGRAIDGFVHDRVLTSNPVRGHSVLPFTPRGIARRGVSAHPRRVSARPHSGRLDGRNARTSARHPSCSGALAAR
jgi:hypothetical protein